MTIIRKLDVMGIELMKKMFPYDRKEYTGPKIQIDNTIAEIFRGDTMRIIRDASEEVEKKKICKNCGSELGYLPIDIREEKEYDYGGGCDIVHVIICPKCSNKIKV